MINNNTQAYDDRNFYYRFIVSQLAWRQDLEAQGHFKGLDQNDVFYNFSVVNAYGLRASGATTAVAQLINPHKDLYVGHGHCDNMRSLLMSKGFGKNDLNYLNFNAVTLDNTNFDVDELANKIGKFFENNNMEVLKFEEIDPMLTRRSKFNAPRFEQVDLSEVERNLSKELVFGAGKDFRNDPSTRTALNKLRGMSFVRVFIDIGNINHRMYCNRVNRLMDWLRVMTPPTCQLVFILT